MLGSLFSEPWSHSHVAQGCGKEAGGAPSSPGSSQVLFHPVGPPGPQGVEGDTAAPSPLPFRSC